MRNQSLYCDNSYIDLGQQFLVEQKDVSFSIWINPNQRNEEMTILSQNNARYGNGRFACGIFDNKIYIYTGAKGTSYGTTNIKENNWYYLVLIFHNNKISCYINGNKELEVEIDSFQKSNTFLLSYYQGASAYFNGYIDEFKIYDYALSEIDIKEYMYEIGEKLSNLIIYFNFDEIFDNDNIVNLVGNEKYKIYNFVKISKDIIPPLQVYKYLIKQNNIYYSLKSSFYQLGQPKDNEEKEKWYKENGINNLNILCTNKELIPQIKKQIGSKFQITKWEEK